jgi:hypothetical protein
MTVIEDQARSLFLAALERGPDRLWGWPEPGCSANCRNTVPSFFSRANCPSFSH